MIQDLQFACRQLMKAPGFAIAAVFVLTLGIGANTAVFSLVNTMLFAPPGYARAHELVQLFSQDKKNPKSFRAFSYPTLTDIRARNPVFSGVAAHTVAMVGVGEKGNTRRVFADIVSADYFAVLGVAPLQGRVFLPEEETPGRDAPVALVSYSYWTRHNRVPSTLGSQIQINGRSFTVIGILPQTFTGTMTVFSPEVWVPLSAYDSIANNFATEKNKPLASREGEHLMLIARFKPGMNAIAAEPALKTLAANLEQAFPVEQKDQAFTTRTVSRFSISDDPPDDSDVAAVGPLLMGMAAVVLLVASLNLANMLLARGTARAKEIALRLALGASRWRIVRQLVTEGLLLALFGGVAGLILSVWCNNLLLHSLATLLNNVNFSFIVDLSPDATVLAVTFLFCLLATVLFSPGRALKATKADLVNDLKQQIGEPPRIGRFSRFFAPRHISVMAQIALSLMLLFAAGLFFRGALKAAGLNPGFIAAGDLITEMDFTLVKKEPTDARREIFNIVRRARELPGVRAVGVATMLPYNNFTSTRRIMSTRTTLSNDPKAPDPGATARYTASTPGYFDAIGVKLLRGRDFTQAECEDKDGRRIAIIDQEMAKKLFPNEDAVGRHVRYTIPPKDGSPNDMEVVGVVGTHRHDVQNDTPLARLFVPFAQGYSGDVFLHVRFNTMDRKAVAGMTPSMRSTLHEIDPDLPLLSIAPWVDVMERSVGLWIVKLGAILFGVFGAIVLLVAVVGVYGVKAYAVACRTHEIGIRMALGAHRKDVFALIMRQGAIQTGLAVSLGLLLSLGAGRVLSQILYQVTPSDPFALITSSLLLALATLLACFLPARRAMHVNPITALRTE